MKRKLFMLLIALLCIPCLTLAEEVMVVDKKLNAGECYKNICYDAINKEIILDGSSDLFTYTDFENITIRVKKSSTLDFGLATGKFEYPESSTIKFIIEDDSTLTFKNINDGILFDSIDELIIQGGKNSNLIFDNCKKGIEVNNGEVTIENVDIKATIPMSYLFHVNFIETNGGIKVEDATINADVGLKDGITLKNSNIDVDQDESIVTDKTELDTSLIGVNGASIKIIDSSFKSSFKRINKTYITDLVGYAIYAMGNIEIINSNISLDDYFYAIFCFGQIKIDGSIILFNDCYGCIWTLTLYFNNSVSKMHFTDNTNPKATGKELEMQQSVGTGYSMSDNFEIENGYLEFTGNIMPITFQLFFSLEEGYDTSEFFILSDKMEANKKYSFMDYQTPYGDIVMIGKEGLPAIVKEGDDNEELFENQEDMLLTDFILRGKTVVHFNAGDGSGEMIDVTLDYLSDKLPENEFTVPDGKQFKGWSTSKGGEIITKLGNYSEITLYPIWEDAPKEEKKEKENPNTGAIISVSCILGLLSIGVAGIAISTRYKKFY